MLDFAGSYKWLTITGLFLSVVAMVLGMVPYICIWLVVRDLISAAPDWTQAADILKYGWTAFGFAMGSRQARCNGRASNRSGKTVLVIAHRMRTVAAADKIVVLADGKVAEKGTPDELLNKNGMYAHMAMLQNESGKWSIA